MNKWSFPAVVLSVFLLTGCARSAEQLIAPEGLQVGYKKLEVESKATGEKFPLALTYPSLTPAEEVEFAAFKMKLAVGGKIAAGKFPLVVISHGSGGTNIAHRSIAFALVKQGYVVAMPLHPKNNFKNNEAEGSLGNWKNRPLHISATIDALASDQQYSTSIDSEKVAVIGHSAGGYTALAVAGGVADTAHIIDLCRSNPKINEPFCGLVKDNRLKAEKIENSRDSRVKAIVMMAPVGILFKSQSSLSEVDLPALLLTAEKDSELSEPYQSQIIARNYKNKNKLRHCSVKNAGHYSFITPFPAAIKSELGVVAEDPAGFDRKAFQQMLSADILDFLDGALSSAAKPKTLPTVCFNA